jgi:AcrR family transcriptional regulator
MGLRETKKQRTREELSWATVQLAVERGLENVLVEDIAAAAGVSPRTFNNYFANKYEAFCARSVDRARWIGDALRARPVDEPLWDAITHAVLRQYGEPDHVPDRKWITGVRLAISTPALWGEHLKSHAAMAEALAEAIAARTGTDPEHDLLPRVLGGAVSAATEVAVEHWLRADPPVPLEPLVRRALDELRRIHNGQ